MSIFDRHYKFLPSRIKRRTFSEHYARVRAREGIPTPYDLLIDLQNPLRG